MSNVKYHSKAVEVDELENLRLEDHAQTLQKQNKYYSSHDESTIKKRLIDHYDKGSSTHQSAQNYNGSLINQLQEAVQSYRPVFKEPTVKKRPNYAPLNLQPEKPQFRQVIHEEYREVPSTPNNPTFATMTKEQFPQPPRKHITRFDKEIASLYKQNRNINLEYRKQKFMQIFLKPQSSSYY